VSTPIFDTGHNALIINVVIPDSFGHYATRGNANLAGGLIPDAVFEPVPFHARKLQVIRTLSHYFYLRQIFSAAIFRKPDGTAGQDKESGCDKKCLHHCASFPLKNLACENTAMSPVEE